MFNNSAITKSNTSDFSDYSSYYSLLPARPRSHRSVKKTLIIDAVILMG